MLDALATGLVDAGADVLLVTTGDSTCPVDKTFVYDHGRRDELGNVVIEVRHLVHAYEAVAGCDIVHDHTVAGPLYASRLDLPVVTTCHGPFTTDMKAIYRAVVPPVSLVAISHHQASTAPNLPISAVIHHGVATPKYPVGSGRGGYLLFLGRMSPTKGLREAIAVARACDRQLLIAAKMAEPVELEFFAKEIEPLLDRDVQYLGEVGGDEKLELLGSALALINPIKWDEPFGLCMIEALACGTPVVASPRGAAPEIVDDGLTGFLAADIGGLATAVRRVAGLDRRACRQAAESRFSAERMAAEHLALYRAVLHGTRARDPRSAHRAPIERR